MKVRVIALMFVSCTAFATVAKYNYNPSKDDIYFSTILLYYSLREMGLDAEVTGFMDRVVARVEEARNASLNRFRNDIAARYGAPAPGGGAINLQDLNNYLALVTHTKHSTTQPQTRSEP